MALKTTKRHRNQPKTAKSKRSAAAQAPIVQTFTHHIRELRKRLFWTVVIGLLVGTLVYSYHDFFIKMIMAPLGDQKLIYLTPAGGFAFIFSVTLYISLIILLPFILYQIYAFIRPAIPSHTNKLSAKVAIAAFLLMLAGVSFGYFFAVPSGLKFLTTFASDYVTPSLTADSYLNFVLGYIFGIGVLFELPLLLLFWHWIHPLTPKGILNSERYIIVVAFVLAAIISPTPDAVNQAMIAVPIIVVYQFGVIGVLLSVRKKNKAEKRQRVLAAKKEALVSPAEPVFVPNPPVSAPLSAQKQPTVRRHKAVDGFTSNSSKKVAKPTLQVRRQIIVPQSRGRLINDFGPARKSAIDTSR